MKNTYGLIGHPLLHSFSKSYFTVKFVSEGIDAEYLNFDIADISLFPQVLAEHNSLKGFNVTIPYKEKIIPYLDSLNEAAQQIGAVNTVKLTNGQLVGYNTDYIGFMESIKPMLLPQDKKALVLGTGGSSKAVLYTLDLLGIEYTLMSRHSANGQLTYQDLSEKIVVGHTIIINTTPVGMFPNIHEAPPFPYQWLSSQHLLFDLIYNPAETQFLQHGIKVGVRTKNGLEMLQLQADAAWGIWNS